jgi:hypothetical protein
MKNSPFRTGRSHTSQTKDDDRPEILKDLLAEPAPGPTRSSKCGIDCNENEELATESQLDPTLWSARPARL